MMALVSLELLVEISLVFQEHPDDEIWEQYALGHLDDRRLEPVEEHLFVCPRCQKTLAQTDQYLRSMKAATAQLAGRRPKRNWKVLTFPGPLRIAPAVAVAVAAILMLTRPTVRSIELAPASVALESLRGGSDTVMNRAPSKRPLDLSVRLAAAPASVQYRMEMADRWGRIVWSGPAKADRLSIFAHVDKGFSPGTYWVRLYGDSPELLAEYGLNLD